MQKLKLLLLLLVTLATFCRAQQQTTNLIYNNSFEYINSASPTYYEYNGGAFGLTDTSYKTSGLSCWVDAGMANGIVVYDTSTYYMVRDAPFPMHLKKAVSWNSGLYYNNGLFIINHLQNKLRTPLQSGVTYYISGYLNAVIDSFRPSFNYADSNYMGFHSHVKQIGVLLTSSKVHTNDLRGFVGTVPSATYNIQPFPNRIYSNAWQKFEMLYTAQGGEEYLTLSNFDTSFNNIMIYPDHDSILLHKFGTIDYSFITGWPMFLFLDNFTMVALADTGKQVLNPLIQNPDSLRLGRDRMLCNAAPSITLNAGNCFSTYQWNTGATTPTIQVNQTGTYTVTVSNGCQSYSDSITLVPDTNFVMPSYADAGVCTNTPVSYYVDTGIAYNSMLWSNGDTAYTSSFGAGQHWLRLTNDCHLQYDTFSVTYYGADTIDLIQQQKYVLCSNANPSIAAPSGYNNYQWSNSNQGQQLTPLQSGTYYLSATDGHSCLIADTINVVLVDAPQLTSAWPADTTLCIGKGFDVNLSLNTDSAHYAWNINDADQHSLHRYIDDAGTYTFNVQNQCGAQAYSFSVALIDCDTVVVPPIDTTTQPIDTTVQLHIYIPNAFTPNGDGNNDVFKIYGNGTVLYYECTIYNRWGEVVYQSYDATAGWNGTYKNADLPTGSYVYVIKYSSTTDAQGRLLKGSVMLMR